MPFTPTNFPYLEVPAGTTPVLACLRNFYSDEPNLAVIDVRVASATDTTAGYTFTVTNLGGSAIDLGDFIVQSWLSADAVLDKPGDAAAAGLGLQSVVLAPGASSEGQFAAPAPTGVTFASHPFLIIEVHSDGAVTETSYTDNVYPVRVPWALVHDVAVQWVDGTTATRVTWQFTPDPPYYADAGFRVELAGGHTVTVPAGAREVTVPLDQTGGGLSCFATVYPLDADGDPLAGELSPNICV